MKSAKTHAFCNDAIGLSDAVELGQRIKKREVSSKELVDAAMARAAAVSDLGAMTGTKMLPVHKSNDGHSSFSGVPFLIKDNIDIRGYPTQFGTKSYVAAPATSNSSVTTMLLSMGLTAIGKSRLSEFAFNGSCEAVENTTRNPWNPMHASGGSSGGAATAVAAGIVPIAHGNDAGGSLRIPASCCGLVALKATRGRLPQDKNSALMPVKLVSEGVLTRSVRDTAHFFAEAERHYKNKKLLPIGLVNHTANKDRPKTIGVVHSHFGAAVDPEVSRVVDSTAELLAGAGHHIVESVQLPLKDNLMSDFMHYWGMLSCMTQVICLLQLRSRFDRNKLEVLTKGLSAHYLQNIHATPQLFLEMHKAKNDFNAFMGKYDAILMPTVTKPAQLVGYLDPNGTFEDIVRNLTDFTPFTPIANATGNPAISLPMGMSQSGLPIGIQLIGGYGQERSLLQLAYMLEEAKPFPRIWLPS